MNVCDLLIHSATLRFSLAADPISWDIGFAVGENEPQERGERNMFMLTKDLPDFIQAALKSVSFNKKDIRVKVQEKVRLDGGGEKGCRGFIVMIRSDGKTETHYGSWGGANPFEKKAVDQNLAFDVPPQCFVLQGSSGGNRPVMADLIVHPATMNNGLLAQPEVPNLPIPTAVALFCLSGLKASYRFNAWERVAIDNTSEFPIQGRKGYDAALQDLVAMKLAKMNKAGAICITTEGKNQANALKKVIDPKYRHVG